MDEGYELWDVIKSRIEPLKRGRDRVHPASAADTPASFPQLSAKKHGPALPSDRPSCLKPDRRSPHPARSASPHLHFEIDRKKARRLAGGKVPIDAVLDLHGLRQNEAHAALVRFLHQAQARRLKFVKIVTGKGSAGRQTAPPGESWSEPEPGVLRRQVPLWLAEPSVRALIVGTSTAGRRHGGSGALYVELRRRESKKA
jgi:DNA-nicking Smr family endonuclease